MIFVFLLRSKCSKDYYVHGKDNIFIVHVYVSGNVN